MEYKLLQDYLNGLAILNPKVQMIVNMCTIRKGLKPEVNKDDLITQIHLYESWYDRNFATNKSQLFLSLCMEQGYKIKTIELNRIEECPFTNKELKVEMTELIKKQNKDYIEDKLTKEDRNYETVNEKMIKKLDRLHVTIEELDEGNIMKLPDKEKYEMKVIKEIAIDDDIYVKCLRAKSLYDSTEKLIKIMTCKYKNDTVDEWAWIYKDMYNPKNLIVLKKVEDIIGLNRKDIDKDGYLDKIKYDGKIVQKLTDMKEDIGNLLYGKISKKKIITRVNKKLNNIKDNNGLIDLMADMYNKFDKIISIENKRIRDNSKLIREKIYTINKITLEKHQIFMKALRNWDKDDYIEFDSNECIKVI